MRVEHTLDTKYFLDICSNLTFKNQDEKEAQDIVGSSSGSVMQVLKSAPNRWADHYLIYDEDKIVCVITLDYMSNLHYFVTKDLTDKNALSFVRTIKKLAYDTLEKRNVIFVTTRDWYSQAVKFNKLIGFKVLKTFKGRNYTTWYLSKNKGY